MNYAEEKQHAALQTFSGEALWLKSPLQLCLGMLNNLSGTTATQGALCA
jgi:hypothetical protein